MIKQLRKKVVCLILSFCVPMFAIADENTDLAKKAQNPVEKMVTIPFNNNFNFSYGANDNTQYILDVKPVIPFSLNDSWNLISRTIIPVIHQPNLGHGYLNGIGDLNPTFFLSPAHPNKLIWGIGPTIFLPTAMNPQLGQGKYSIGPSVVVLSMPGNWVIGFLTFNVWSIGGQSSRSTVNSLSFQYFINYNFPHGWYITSSPTLTADWMVSPGYRWTIPFGLGVGRVFSIGKQAINTSIQAYDNVKTPKITGPNWQLQLNISLLFPDT